MGASDLAVLDRSLRHGERVSSPLTRWMVANHDGFAALLHSKGVNWLELCNGFAELGLTNAEGGPLTPFTARATWLRARKIVARQRAAAASATAQSANLPPPPTPPAGSTNPPGPVESSEEFPLARLRSGYRSTSTDGKS